MGVPEKLESFICGQRAQADDVGRLLVVERSIADAHSGHGIVMPQCLHGGPGRAGNGNELGGLNGLRFYHQSVAIQGSTEFLADLQAKGAVLHQ
jgi:3,4-dehydroadipyl-CoA semialdehyde dehydrogenase